MANIGINSIVYSWASVTARYDMVPFGEGLQQFDYEQSRERKQVYGSRPGGGPVGYTSGKYAAAPVNLKMLNEDATKFMLYLTTRGAGSIGRAEFALTLNVAEFGVVKAPLAVVIEGCHVIRKKNAAAEGTDELAVEFEIGCLRITENGMRLFDLDIPLL